jgi:hypothetical protein
VSFVSGASNLVGDDTNLARDVFVRDIAKGTTRRASVGTGNLEANAPTIRAELSLDGRKVVFSSTAGNLPPADGATTADVFVRELDNEVTRFVTQSGTGSDDSALGATSADARFVVVISNAPLIPALHNNVSGVYLADFGPGCGASNFCTALPNSTGNPASIGAMGEMSQTLDNLVLACVDLPTHSVGMFVSGTTPVDPGVPFGNGLRCIGGTLMRHRVIAIVEGAALDWQSLAHPDYAGVQPGDVLYFQCIYRDMDAGGARFNTSDGLAVTVCF